MSGSQYIPAASWSSINLPKLPDFLQAMMTKAQAVLDVERIVVFGSRARGDHTDRSDYDFCFYLTSSRNWAAFVVDQQESAATLCALDLVSFNELDQQLADEITKHGVVLYERKKS
jgi:predicted nucleotidyltransferase